MSAIGAALAAMGSSGPASGTVLFDSSTPGTYSYTVAAGVTSIRVWAHGGGQNGSTFGYNMFDEVVSGSGGRGGNAIKATRSVAPGDVITVVVAAGKGGFQNGGFGNPSTVTASGSALTGAGGGTNTSSGGSGWTVEENVTGGSGTGGSIGFTPGNGGQGATISPITGGAGARGNTSDVPGVPGGGGGGEVGGGGGTGNSAGGRVRIEVA